jgi:hypothetical protein
LLPVRQQLVQTSPLLHEPQLNPQLLLWQDPSLQQLDWHRPGQVAPHPSVVPIVVKHDGQFGLQQPPGPTSHSVCPTLQHAGLELATQTSPLLHRWPPQLLWHDPSLQQLFWHWLGQVMPHPSVVVGAVKHNEHFGAQQSPVFASHSVSLAEQHVLLQHAPLQHLPLQHAPPEQHSPLQHAPLLQHVPLQHTPLPVQVAEQVPPHPSEKDDVLQAVQFGGQQLPL